MYVKSYVVKNYFLLNFFDGLSFLRITFSFRKVEQSFISIVSNDLKGMMMKPFLRSNGQIDDRPQGQNGCFMFRFFSFPSNKACIQNNFTTEILKCFLNSMRAV